MKLMGASLALAGVYGCERGPEETIVPYVQPPEQAQANRTSYYATAFPFEGYARGVLVESYQGRPIKIEGNPAHPASLGADRLVHAGDDPRPLRPRPLADAPRGRPDRHLGGLPEPDRVRRREARSRAGRGGADPHRDGHVAHAGRPAHRFLKKYPKARWHQYQPVNRDSAGRARAGVGRPVETIYDF